MSAAGAPKPRSGNATIWTGKELIVWGGVGPTVNGGPSDGAVYDLATDRWAPITATGAPAGRDVPGAAWAGDRLLIWGGVSIGGGELPLADGAQLFLDP